MKGEMTSARERIEGNLREAERELQQLDKRLQVRPDFGPGKGNADGYSWEMALARRKTVTARINALREALIRVREGTYGRCKRCGAQIDARRLEILSTATLCIACARVARAPLTSVPATSMHAALQK